jgi:hypothetical protein
LTIPRVTAQLLSDMPWMASSVWVRCTRRRGDYPPPRIGMRERQQTSTTARSNYLVLATTYLTSEDNACMDDESGSNASSAFAASA